MLFRSNERSPSKGLRTPGMFEGMLRWLQQASAAQEYAEEKITVTKVEKQRAASPDSCIAAHYKSR